MKTYLRRGVHPAQECLIIYLYTNKQAIKIKQSLETKYEYSGMVMRKPLVTAFSDLLCYWHFQFYVHAGFLCADTHTKNPQHF
jgi:hypothetical protein